MDVIELMTALMASEEAGTPAPAVAVGDAIAISQHFHHQADRGAEALTTVAKQLDVTIACGEGCTGCCHELVMVRGPEAAEVVAWLSAPERAAARAAFLANYSSWRATVGNAPERLAALLEAGDAAAYQAAHREQWRKAVLCAFNQDGKCLVYDVRPMLCRNAHAVGTSAHCHPADTSGTAATKIVFVPIDNLVELSRRVMRAADRAARGAAAGQESLCKTVASALHLGGSIG
jgi:Fe-S-cluster containining protein